MEKKVNEKNVAVNECGIMIKKCCGSCKHRVFDEQECRCCQLSGKHVRGKHVCDNWSMSEGLKRLGRERGKVQRREYQLFMMEVRASEQTAITGEEMTPASVESIRRDFELKHGSIYELH